MTKKQYMRPAIQVVKILQTQMLCSSPGAKDLVDTEEFNWNSDGLDEDDC